MIGVIGDMGKAQFAIDCCCWAERFANISSEPVGVWRVARWLWELAGEPTTEFQSIPNVGRLAIAPVERLDARLLDIAPVGCVCVCARFFFV